LSLDCQDRTLGVHREKGEEAQDWGRVENDVDFVAGEDATVEDARRQGSSPDGHSPALEVASLGQWVRFQSWGDRTGVVLSSRRIHH